MSSASGAARCSSCCTGPAGLGGGGLVGGLLAVQAQELRGARLALRARSRRRLGQEGVTPDARRARGGAPLQAAVAAALEADAADVARFGGRIESE